MRSGGGAVRMRIWVALAAAGALLAVSACSGGGGHGGGGSGTAAGGPSPGIVTQRYDAQRSGLNTQETALTPNAVRSRFGKLFACAIDGEAYAEPLVVANLSIAGGTHNVVFVATQNDSVFAFDADANPCAQYWQKSFLGAGVTPVPHADTGTDDIDQQIGITGTPVIDPATKTLYVVAKTKEAVGAGCSGGSPCYRQRLHALDLATGAEKMGGPANLSNAITVPGTGDTGDGTCPSAPGDVPFCPLRENQRPALLLSNGRVYIAWASHGDNGPYHGWVIGYSAADLTQPPALFNATPNGDAAGIWMSGTGPAADANGNLYVITGNGTFDTSGARTNYGDSFLKLRTAPLSVADFFTPSNQDALSNSDFDLGSGGALVLPDAAGSAAHPHLLVGGDKQGILYLIDRDNMSGFHSNGDQIVQEVTVISGSPCGTCGIFSTPLYWQGQLYVVPVDDVVKQYTLTDGALSTTPAQTSNEVFGFPGASPVISANGTTNAILWVVDTSNNGTPNGTGSDGPAILFAYEPATLSLLYHSPTSGVGAAGNAVKFVVPTVVNGKVYLGTQTELSVFGLTN